MSAHEIFRQFIQHPKVIFFVIFSQCIAAIACAELPVQQWPDLIPTLVQNVTNNTATESLKEQTLEAIGYICQDIVCLI